MTLTGRHIRHQIIHATAIGLMLFLISGCEPSRETRPLKRIKVQLVWRHQSQFAGLYAADQRGFYRAEGLEVEFIPRSKTTSNVFEKVAMGEAEFGIGYGAGIVTSRDRGLPVQAVACIYRHYALVFITLGSSRITRPQDFPGRTIRALTPGGAAVAFRAMMTRMGLDPRSIKEIDVGFSFDKFLSGEVDIWPGYVTNEVLLARKKGVAVNRILPSDYGVHLYGDSIFTTDHIIQASPDLVLGFVRASLKGWQWAIENPGEAGPLALKYDPGLDVQHQIELITASIPLIYPGKGRIGWMETGVWEGIHQILMDQNILKAPVDLTDVFTTQFLEQAYRKNGR